MFDSNGRNIHYLRLSVTDLCNLRCRYCMPDGVEKLEREAVLTYEEFLRLAELFAQCGIDTVRVTGGEPLVRKSVAQLVAGLKATPGIRHVSMTTNGTLLAQQLPALLDAGLDSVNISLDTLDPAVFRADSLIGCAGLLNAARAGNVTIANAVGNGVADDKLVYTYVPDLIRYYLGEEPIIAGVDTWRLEEDAHREEVMDRLDELVVKPVDGMMARLGPSSSNRMSTCLEIRVSNCGKV